MEYSIKHCLQKDRDTLIVQSLQSCCDCFIRVSRPSCINFYTFKWLQLQRLSTIDLSHPVMVGHFYCNGQPLHAIRAFLWYSYLLTELHWRNTGNLCQYPYYLLTTTVKLLTVRERKKIDYCIIRCTVWLVRGLDSTNND